MNLYCVRSARWFLRLRNVHLKWAGEGYRVAMADTLR